MSRYAAKHHTISHSRYGTAQAARYATAKPYPARRELQPMVAAYLHREGIQFKQHSGGFSLRCPFHDDDHPSLLMTAETGRYRCMACQATGGNLVAFHAAVHGMEWKDALRILQERGLA
jgi:DNA primase